MRARLEQQSEYLNEISERFRGQKFIQFEHDTRDITKRDQRVAIAEQLDAAKLS